MLTQNIVKPLCDLRQLGLNFLQTRLALFDRAALRLHVEFFRFNVCGKFVQTCFQSSAFFFQLDFLSGKFFEANDVALLLHVERVDFVAHAGEVLRGGE